jgi:hypothetical protein
MPSNASHGHKISAVTVVATLTTVVDPDQVEPIRVSIIIHGMPQPIAVNTLVQIGK